jgi:tetratricopeptide (TPR) repeat protein
MKPLTAVTERQEQDAVERARAFEAAGDESVYESAIEEAKVNYGWAIDTFLEARAFEEAIRICRKLIRLSPDVVRTRYTLLFLLVGLGRYGEALPALDEYLRIVQATGTRSFAIPRLQLLAQVTEDAETSARIESILAGLGAEQLGYTVHFPREHQSDDATSGAERVERWETLLPIALRDD